MRIGQTNRWGVRSLSLFTALACGILSFAGHADTLRVPRDYSTIQAAINAAQDGDVVIVDDGTWSGSGNTDLNFDGKAIFLRSHSRDARLCIIDCEGAGQAFNFVSGEGPESVVLGFTIRRGDGQTGGAVFIRSSSPTFRDCIFEANESEGNGGAISADTDSGPTITRCLFVGNHAARWGGAISCFTRTKANVIDCAFSGNSAAERGGAIGTFGGSQLHIVNCTFYGNTADIEGGAFYSGGGLTILRNCILWNDSPDEISYTGAENAPGVTHSNVMGGYGSRNIDEDPKFADPDGADNTLGTPDDNLRLLTASPSIDTGTGLMFEFHRNADAWKERAGRREAYAFDEFFPGIENGSGGLAESGFELELDGGSVTFRHIDGEGFGEEQPWAVIDASTGSGQVSDGNLTSVDGAMVMTFDPPITAFYSYYASQDVNQVGRMRLWSQGRVVSEMFGATSPHNVYAIGHGFTSRLPIDRLDFISWDNNGGGVLMGAFVGVMPGDSPLGTVEIPGYQGPRGSTVDLDFAMVFDDGNPQLDLDRNPRAVDGNRDGVAWIDMGSYEFAGGGGGSEGERAKNRRLDVRKGTLVSGGVREINRDDNVWVKVDSEFEQGSQQPHITLTELIVKTEVENPERLAITLRSRLNQAGGRGAILLWNFNSRKWDNVKGFGIGAAEKAVKAEDIPASDYVNSFGRMRVRLRHTMVVANGGGFRSFFDLLKVHVQ